MPNFFKTNKYLDLREFKHVEARQKHLQSTWSYEASKPRRIGNKATVFHSYIWFTMKANIIKSMKSS